MQYLGDGRLLLLGSLMNRERMLISCKDRSALARAALSLASISAQNLL